jgi:hypothetical protein
MVGAAPGRWCHLTVCHLERIAHLTFGVHPNGGRYRGLT